MLRNERNQEDRGTLQHENSDDCSIKELLSRKMRETEKEVSIHSSILGWKIPCTEEPGGLQSMGSQSLSQLSN